MSAPDSGRSRYLAAGLPGPVGTPDGPLAHGRVSVARLLTDSSQTPAHGRFVPRAEQPRRLLMVVCSHSRTVRASSCQWARCPLHASTSVPSANDPEPRSDVLGGLALSRERCDLAQALLALTGGHVLIPAWLSTARLEMRSVRDRAGTVLEWLRLPSRGCRSTALHTLCAEFCTRRLGHARQSTARP